MVSLSPCFMRSCLLAAQEAAPAFPEPPWWTSSAPSPPVALPWEWTEGLSKCPVSSPDAPCLRRRPRPSRADYFQNINMTSEEKSNQAFFVFFFLSRAPSDPRRRQSPSRPDALGIPQSSSPSVRALITPSAPARLTATRHTLAAITRSGKWACWARHPEHLGKMGQWSRRIWGGCPAPSWPGGRVLV